MAFVSTRNQTIGGKKFKRGAVVPNELMTSEKASQLVGVRRLRDTEQRVGKYVAVRPFRGSTRGERVDVKGIGAAKLAQLLDNRIIEPIADATAT